MQGDANNCISTPELINELSGQQCVSISAGEYHSVCITAVGSVFSWGHGGFGALGHGNLKNCNEPTVIDALQGARVVSVAAGSSHTMLCVEREGGGGDMEEGWLLNEVNTDKLYGSLPGSAESLERPQEKLILVGEEEKEGEIEFEGEKPVKVIDPGGAASGNQISKHITNQAAMAAMDTVSPLSHSTYYSESPERQEKVEEKPLQVSPNLRRRRRYEAKRAARLT